MEKERAEMNEKCANPACGRRVDSGSLYCENCEIEWTLYRRDLRGGDREKEKEVLVLESR